jgi:DNA-binding GntR family transcriptional regulator
LGLADLLENGELIDVAREHLTIVETIATRNAEEVEGVMHAHISQARGRWAKPVAPSSAALPKRSHA